MAPNPLAPLAPMAPLAPPSWFGRRDPVGGYFGAFGGRFVPETLVAPIEALEAAYLEARRDPAFGAELQRLLQHYVGRETPLWDARRLSAACGGGRILLKREDLTHTGAHKINNALGQALLAKRMGKTRIVAETGAGQHGVASATACALLGLECVVYMGTEDMRRQALNVFRMRLLGAAVVGVDSGSCTLKDAINEAMRDWVARPDDTHYLLGSALGPHPYPLMVREFQSVIGREARAQCLVQVGRLPDAVIACVGGGSNAIGIFDAFIDDASVKLIGVEAGGMRRALPAAPRACCRAHEPTCCKTSTATSRRRTRYRPVSTTRPWARSTRICRRRGAPSIRMPLTLRHWTRSSSWPVSRASSPRWSRRMRLRMC